MTEPVSKRTLITIKDGKRRFNHRIAGLAFRDGHVLVHRAIHETFWTFPGGRATTNRAAASSAA